MEKDNYSLAISKLTGNNKTPLKQEKNSAVVPLSVKTHAEQNFSLT